MKKLFAVKPSALKLALAAPTPLSFIAIPTTAPDLIAPGRGANDWYSDNTQVGAANIPNPSFYTAPLDNDTRFLWSQLQPNAAGVYNWAEFDRQIKYSIDRGMRMSFGIMPVCSSCAIGGAEGATGANSYGLGYPLYVHTAMQAEAVPDWKFSGGGNANMWIPNWNSNSYLTAWEAFLKDLAAYIAKSSYKGVPYASAIYHIDVRGYGNWGEWHTYPWRDSGVIPQATKATDATLIRIIQAHITAFPNFQLISLVNTYSINGDAGSANNTPGGSGTTAQVGYFALTAKNNVGSLGWRSDHLGSEANDAWVPYETTLNQYSYNGIALKGLIADVWKKAPVVGEPLNSLSEVSNSNKIAFFNLVNEVITHHISQFSNENLVNGSDANAQANYLAASKASGYRNLLTGGSISAITAGSAFAVTLNWSNVGVAPVYENWNVTFEIRDSTGKVFATFLSGMNLKSLLPGTASFTDNFTLDAGVPAGNYNVFLVIRDPLNYRKPLPLAIQGVQVDGSYLLASVAVAGVTPTPIPVPVPTPTPVAKTITSVVVNYSDGSSVTNK